MNVQVVQERAERVVPNRSQETPGLLSPPSGTIRTLRNSFRIVRKGVDMTAEASETTTFIPEDPEELASVVGFLAAHERLRGTMASPGYALVGAEEHDRIELPHSVHLALTKVVAALHAG